MKAIDWFILGMRFGSYIREGIGPKVPLSFNQLCSMLCGKFDNNEMPDVEDVPADLNRDQSAAAAKCMLDLLTGIANVYENPITQRYGREQAMRITTQINIDPLPIPFKRRLFFDFRERSLVCEVRSPSGGPRDCVSRVSIALPDIDITGLDPLEYLAEMFERSRKEVERMLNDPDSALPTIEDEIASKLSKKRVDPK